MYLNRRGERQYCQYEAWQLPEKTQIEQKPVDGKKRTTQSYECSVRTEPQMTLMITGRITMPAASECVGQKQ